jgi:hypothetical protein
VPPRLGEEGAVTLDEQFVAQLEAARAERDKLHEMWATEHERAGRLSKRLDDALAERDKAVAELELVSRTCSEAVQKIAADRDREHAGWKDAARLLVEGAQHMERLEAELAEAHRIDVGRWQGGNPVGVMLCGEPMPGIVHCDLPRRHEGPCKAARNPGGGQ